MKRLRSLEIPPPRARTFALVAFFMLGLVLLVSPRPERDQAAAIIGAFVWQNLGLLLVVLIGLYGLRFAWREVRSA